MRQDLKMGPGKIASQCAREMPNSFTSDLLMFLQHLSHFSNVIVVYFLMSLILKFFSYDTLDAATGMYAELMQRYVIAHILVCRYHALSLSFQLIWLLVDPIPGHCIPPKSP